MPDTLPHRLARHATLPTLLLLAVLAGLLYFIFFPALLSNPPTLQQTGALDAHLSYTPQQAYQALEAYEPAGRMQYARTILLLDIVFPVVYALLLSLLAARGLVHAFPASPRIQSLALLPFAAMLCDWLENGCILVLLARFPQRLDGLAAAAGGFTLLKWIVLGLSVLLAAGGLIAARLRKS